jgi:hypothetical protein
MMTVQEQMIDDYVIDLMGDIIRISKTESFSDVEKEEYIEAYIKLKLNVVYTNGKIHGIEETKETLKN